MDKRSRMNNPICNELNFEEKENIIADINVKWYTDEWKYQRSESNALYKRYKRNPELIDYQTIYKKERAKYNLGMKQTKYEADNTACENNISTFGQSFQNYETEVKKKNTDLFHSIFETLEYSDTYQDIKEKVMDFHKAAPPNSMYNFTNQEKFTTDWIENF